MQRLRQSGGPRGQSKVELAFLDFSAWPHTDIHTTYFSASQSVEEWKDKSCKGVLWLLPAEHWNTEHFAKCRKQELLRIVL